MGIALDSQLKLVQHYSQIEFKSALESIDGLGDAYDANKITHDDFVKVVGSMYKDQQIKLILKAFEHHCIIEKPIFKTPPVTRLHLTGSLNDVLVNTVKSQSDLLTGVRAFLSYMPEDWKSAHWSLDDKGLDEFEGTIQDYLQLYIDNMAE